MTYRIIEYKELYVRVKLSVSGHTGGGEYHAVAENLNPLLDAGAQYRNVAAALDALQGVLPEGATPVLRRYFASDAVNQALLLPEGGDMAVSVVQQPPLNGSKVSVWAYWVSDCRTSHKGGTFIMERPGYRHFFNMQLHSDKNPSEEAQTMDVFQDYCKELALHNLSLGDNVIRTWIYVQGVDTRYAGMVEARRRHFIEEGLTEDTHYIASTGIEGRYIHPSTLVFMDAYAIGGITAEQVTYLKGSTHLSPTSEYGVTFERATAVDYGDRRHVFVSGTASIDNRGLIVHPLDIIRQTKRTEENIAVLLAEGGCTAADIAQMTVYLRDTADYGIVSAYIAERYPAVPVVIVCAPVCRPAWLIEIECIAIKETGNRKFAPF
ncbi:MAG: hypothetical protein LBI58_06055 [Tannerellaceae bacterium]|jgi:enamine deaminase RidA (YjgF/YER057c/UK114 family)|nr:hypothetical protein [Tannerellaceae bacterium]